MALVGFADATYLAVEHWRGEMPNCSVIHGCDEVLGSKYAEIGSVPVAFLGALYYLSLVILGLLFLDTKQARWAYLAGYITWLGLIASVAFVWLMAVVIGAYCQFCLVSALTSGLLWIWGRFWMRALRGVGREITPS